MKKKKSKKRKEPLVFRLLLAIVSLVSVILSLVLKVKDRQETVKVIKSDDTLTLLEVKKQTVVK